MRFSQIIHPELILGKRGNKMDREGLAKMLSGVDLHPEGLEVQQWLLDAGDVNLVDACVLMKKWRDSHEKAIYHAGGDFLREIAKVDRSIPVDRLPSRFLAYISFGTGIIRDEEDPIQGAYVFIGPASETSFGHQRYVSGPDAQVLWISYMTDAPYGGKACVLRVELEPYMTMKQLLGKIISQDMSFGNFRDSQEVTITKREIVFRTVINLVLFIFQPDPELERLGPSNSIIGRKRDILLEKANKGKAVFNSCTLPVTFINWKWHKPMTEHMVSGHFRWQPHGPARSQVKLIWIDAFQRGGDHAGQTTDEPTTEG